MQQPILDIDWRDHFDEALSEARRRKRMIVVKPAGQGIGAKDDW